MTRKTMKLRMQKGTDEVNYGGESFKVRGDGYVEVPVELAVSLLSEGGAVEILEEFVKVRHVSDPSLGFSFEGVIYVANDDGIIHAPPASLVYIYKHGFIAC